MIASGSWDEREEKNQRELQILCPRAFTKAALTFLRWESVGGAGWEGSKGLETQFS